MTDMTTSAFRTASVLTAVLVLAACGAGDAPRVTVERLDSAGVQIVRSLGGDVPLDWTFTSTLELGGADAGPASFYRLSPSMVAVGPDGDLYVLDGADHRIVVFDTTGQHLRTLGRKGGGPGEFQLWPSGLAVAPDGSVSAFDIGKRGLVRFAPDGSVLPTRKLEMPYLGGPMVVADSLAVFSVRLSRADADRRYEHLLAMAPSGDTTVLASLARPRPTMQDFGCVGLSLPPLFTPSMAWAARGTRAVVNAGASYVIDAYRHGRRVASYRRDVAPRPVTPEMARREVGDGMTVRIQGGRDCSIEPETLIEGRGYADVLPTIASLAIAPDGMIWVERTAIGDDEPAIDVVSADGEYVGTLPPGSPVPVAFLHDGRPVAIETDALDVERLVVYAVDRTGAAADDG